MKKVKTIAFIAVTVLGISAFTPLVEPAQTAQAASWRMKYRSGWYKVRVKKNTKVDRIKFGQAAYQNHIAGSYTVHKGSVVTIGYYGRDGFDWLIESPHKYKSTHKYAYSAHFKKGSFKVLSHTN